jgi:hypothetical protein
MNSCLWCPKCLDLYVLMMHRIIVNEMALYLGASLQVITVLICSIVHVRLQLQNSSRLQDDGLTWLA